MAGNLQPARYASFNSSSSALSMGEGWRVMGCNSRNGEGQLLGFLLIFLILSTSLELTSGITARDGFDGVTDRTGIFAEDSGSRCGTGGTSLSSRMCGVHVHDVLGRVISVVVDFISLFAVVPPEEFGLEERTTGESELFIAGDIYTYIYIYICDWRRKDFFFGREWGGMENSLVRWMDGWDG